MKYILLSACCLVLSTASAQIPWKVGDPAPPLRVSKWLYGDEVRVFEPGRFYIVEFTHRLCKACVESIPELTVWAKKYTEKLTVISIYSYWPSDPWTEERYIMAIQGLKKRFGENMDFPVALDQRWENTNSLWRGKPSGFPFVFLIDDQGKLAWWGAGGVAMADLGKHLPDIISHSFDGKKDMAEREAYAQQYTALLTSSEKHTLPEVKKRVCELINRFPEKHLSSRYLMFRLLLQHDVNEADRFLKQAVGEYPDFSFDPEEHFVINKYEGLDWFTGVLLFDREAAKAVTAAGKAHILLTKSKLYAYNGAYQEALCAVGQAISNLKEDSMTTDSRLEEYCQWEQAYELKELLLKDPGRARTLLSQLLEERLLSEHAASALVFRMSDGMDAAQLESIRAYLLQLRKQPHR